MRGSNPLHAGAWGLWLVAVVAALSATRNPLYLVMALAWVAVTWLIAGSVAEIMDPERAVPISPVRFGLVVVFISALFNGLMIQAGDHVLFQLPDRLPIIGGPFTAEAMLYGALNALVLTGLYTAFLLVNRVLPVRDMVRLVPRAYHSVAIVVSIAVTFVPATLRQFGQIREAQAVRGHRVSGLRDFLPLLMPLLIGGMERALALAEAMTARGYAANGADPSANSRDDRIRIWTQVVLLVGLLLFTTGLLLRLVWGLGGSSALLLTVGAGSAVAAIWRLGASVPHTIYRPAPWRRVDWLVSLAALWTLVAFLMPLPGLDRSTLYYDIYPIVPVPQLSLWLGLSTWGLLAPAAVMLVAEMRRTSNIAELTRSGNRNQ